MRTALISDLHLGARGDTDLLRRPELMGRLLEGLDGVDRLVLLGDVLEFRERGLDEVLDLAAPVFAELHAALGDAELIYVPGNHDYQADPWLRRRRIDSESTPLGLEQRWSPDPEGPLGRLAERSMSGRVVRLAYPGIWLREDVYATHGHYLDCHSTTPTLENIGASAMQQTLGGLSEDAREPDDYEAALAPLYELAFSLAQGYGHGHGGSRASVQLWRRFASSTPRALIFGGVVIPSILFAVNRAGLGPFKANLAGTQIARAGHASMGEVIEMLGIDAPHVIYGHTHYAGPFGDQDIAEWTVGKTRLTNAGCWIYERGVFGSPSPDSSWYPGTVIRVDDRDAPRVERLLDASDLDQIRSSAH